MNVSDFSDNSDGSGLREVEDLVHSPYKRLQNPSLLLKGPCNAYSRIIHNFNYSNSSVSVNNLKEASLILEFC